MSQQIRLTEKEARVIQRLLRVMREPMPKNGSNRTIVITQNHQYVFIDAASHKGRVDLKR